MTKNDRPTPDVTALQADNAAQSNILKAFTNAEAYGRPGGYIDTDSYYAHFDREKGQTVNVRYSCTYCGGAWFDDAPENHDSDCPVPAARALLEKEA